jgi:hypothetical protein
MASDRAREKAAETASNNFGKHHLSGHPLYNYWKNARYRTTHRRDYIERGIRMQESWLEDPQPMIRYLESLDGWTKGASVDRIDNNRGYEEGNLRWSNPLQQRHNQERVKRTLSSSVDICTCDFCEWARQQGAPPA